VFFSLFTHSYKINSLFQWNKSWRVSGTNTRSTVLHRFVCDAELSQIMANHLRLKIEQHTDSKWQIKLTTVNGKENKGCKLTTCIANVKLLFPTRFKQAKLCCFHILWSNGPLSKRNYNTFSKTKYAVVWLRFKCSSIFSTCTIAFKEINQHISFITGILDLFLL
jgi:hypothetical protein